MPIKAAENKDSSKAIIKPVVIEIPALGGNWKVSAIGISEESLREGLEGKKINIPKEAKIEVTRPLDGIPLTTTIPNQFFDRKEYNTIKDAVVSVATGKSLHKEPDFDPRSNKHLLGVDPKDVKNPAKPKEKE